MCFSLYLVSFEGSGLCCRLEHTDYPFFFSVEMKPKPWGRECDTCLFFKSGMQLGHASKQEMLLGSLVKPEWWYIHTSAALWPQVYLWAPDTNRGRSLSGKHSSSLEKAAVTVCGFVRLFVTAEGVQLSGAEALSCSLLTRPCSFKHEYSLFYCSTEQGGEEKCQIQGSILNL